MDKIHSKENLSWEEERGNVMIIFKIISIMRSYINNLMAIEKTLLIILVLTPSFLCL